MCLHLLPHGKIHQEFNKLRTASRDVENRDEEGCLTDFSNTSKILGLTQKYGPLLLGLFFSKR